MIASGGGTDRWTYGYSPLCPTGHQPFGAAAQKRGIENDISMRVNKRVTERQTDRQTEGRTDGRQTDAEYGQTLIEM